MGIKNMINKVGEKTGDKIAKLSALSPEQLKEVENNRDLYLSEMPDPNDSAAQELTMRLLAASGVEIFNAYLPQLSDLYIPIKNYAEYNGTFKSDYNIRYFNITKWVTDKKENNLEKLVNVYEVLSNEECNIALVFNRKCDTTNVYLAVTNTKNSDNSADVNIYKKRLVNAISGNFPGSELKETGVGAIPCIDSRTNYSVASASNIPTEKSEKFISQTIEKLLDGFAPDTEEEEYSLILLATPIQDVEERKLRLSEIYSGLAPYASWETSYQYSENKSVGSQAQVGVNVGASAGIQNGQNQSITNTDGTTENESKTDTESKGKSETETSGNSYSESNTHTDGSSTSHADYSGSSDSVGASVGVASLGANYQHGWNRGVSDTVSKNISDAVTEGLTNSASRAVANSVGTALAKTLGKAVTKSVAKTAGVFSSTNFGVNFGASFARSSSITATIGKNEGITQHYTNFNIKNALELLESQMKRFEQSMALGMWDFAAYVISEDHNIANNVAHSYISLTQGEESYLSQASINLWRGDVEECAVETKEIVSYLRELRHPVFGLNPAVTAADPKFNVYPSIVTATTSLSGKELAYSLNFPQKSVAGLPVIECTEFGRNIVTYDDNYKDSGKLELGSIFHMNRVEKVKVEIAKQSLASHTFITGSTGSGKSNTVYKMLNEAVDKGVKFLVVEPAKGEYKTVFGSDKDVFVYGTNPNITPLLRINPFSFPDGIHILEHLDRLVEIFNVCWPMYAAMPAVLKKAIEKAYSDCGWNLCTSKNKYDENLFPCFADVAENITTIIDQSDYDSDNKGAYKGALKTRLESLTNGINGMIFVQNEINPQKLFEENVIVDLSRVGSTETKSLLMGMLVLKLQEYRMTTATGINAPLKHITVLEEAHNLLKRTSQESISESSNLLGKSVEMLANAIAEMRTYGEGFIIVDQAPGLLDMSTIRNTNTKIIMRLPDWGDRKLVGKSANLNDDQIAELAKLPCGVAAVYQNEWIQSVLCKVERFDKETTPYTFVPYKNDDIYTCTENTAVSLLDCIMNNEIFRKGDKEDIKKLKFLILNSKLRTVVKRDFIEYIETEKDNTFNTLRKLVYDFLSASEAISRSQANTNLSDWVHSVAEKLNPSIKAYSKQQIDLVIALILYEQSIRNPEYTDLFCRFSEVYESDGGVY